MAETKQAPATANESILSQLKRAVKPDMVKQREGWRDRNGNVHTVDYVEWHTVADILDEIAPDWTHRICGVQEIGDFITVTAEITITVDGVIVPRQGVGTGAANTELGIKKAEHDALKRAAVKFGIGRDLYKRESEIIEREGSASNNGGNGGKPGNPVARNLQDLVTPKQLGMIRALGRENGVDIEADCKHQLGCATDELSKKAASWYIGHLQGSNPS